MTQRIKVLKRAQAVDAMRYDGTELGRYAAREFLEFYVGPETPIFHYSMLTCFFYGGKRVDKGDWIVKEADGEFYFYKPEVFEKMYESVED